MIRYFDASALAKRYVKESHSAAVGRWLSGGTALTGRLSEAEIASALARRCREGSLTARERDSLIETMRRDIASLYVVELSPEVSALACLLLTRHKLRAGDSLHLASALIPARLSNLKIQFVGFDAALNEAAGCEGLELAGL